MARDHNSKEWQKARAYAKTILEPICVTCGKELIGNDWTIDHIDPQGTDGIENLQSMCRECNGRKQDRIMKRIPWKNTRWIS